MSAVKAFVGGIHTNTPNTHVQSDLVRPNRYPTQLLGTDFSSPMHFTPLIRNPRCPTPTRKFRNGYVKRVVQKVCVCTVDFASADKNTSSKQ